MKEYLSRFFRRAYELINPDYARNKRMAKLKELEDNGELARMCASEVHKMFRIKKISREF